MSRGRALAGLLLVAVLARPAGAAPEAGLWIGDAAAPVVASRVEIRVAGIVARTTVTQEFRNPSEDWVSAVYRFPLPDDASVESLRLKAGEQEIIGEIREKQRAREAFQSAAASGQRAALMEQTRGNLFTARVANIPPGATVHVAFDFQFLARFNGTGFELRLPLAVTPRFFPDAANAPGTGPAGTPADAEERFETPLTRDPSRGPWVELSAELDPGFSLDGLESAYHTVDWEYRGNGRYRVQTREKRLPADRDFVLRWWGLPGAAPRAFGFRETAHGSDYGLVLVLPPSPESFVPQQAPREVLFVIDRSGSMEGASMNQARGALLSALGRLQAEDTFNVISFSDTTHTLFDSARAADLDNLRRAADFVSALQADGGTNLLDALRTGLAMPALAGRLRQMVVLTDGAVGNEQGVLAAIHRDIGDTRLFTVGLGSAPNGLFMRAAARAGRGTFSYINSAAELRERMEELFLRLESPALTDIRVVQADSLDVRPRRLPDLYPGEAVVLAVRGNLPDQLQLAGRIGDSPWQARVPLALAPDGVGVAKLWARRAVEDLQVRQRAGGDSAALGDEMLAVALEHQIVSPVTSLVAVQATPIRAAGDAAPERAVPGMVPHGMTMGLNGLPATATGAQLRWLLALLLAIAGVVLFYAATRPPRGAPRSV